MPSALAKSHLEYCGVCYEPPFWGGEQPDAARSKKVFLNMSKRVKDSVGNPKLISTLLSLYGAHNLCMSYRNSASRYRIVQGRPRESAGCTQRGGAHFHLGSRGWGSGQLRGEGALVIALSSDLTQHIIYSSARVLSKLDCNCLFMCLSLQLDLEP